MWMSRSAAGRTTMVGVCSPADSIRLIAAVNVVRRSTVAFHCDTDGPVEAE